MRQPFDAEHVQLIDEGWIVRAIWVSDPERAKDPHSALDEWMSTMKAPFELEIVAEAERFYKKDGANFSGWIVRGGLDYSDPIPNKSEALRQLHYVIEERFRR
jgi:hypothetical protein